VRVGTLSQHLDLWVAHSIANIKAIYGNTHDQMNMCIYICIHTHTHTHIYIYKRLIVFNCKKEIIVTSFLKDVVRIK
jgi:hypothetical protein